MLLISVLLIGLIWRRTKKFWSYGLGAVIVQELTVVLFYMGGTLGDPEGDGIITAAVRQATSDGPLVALLIIPAIIFGWVVPIWMLVKGIQQASTEKNVVTDRES